MQFRITFAAQGGGEHNAFPSNVRAVERTQLITPTIASPSPMQMSAHRGAACYMPLPNFSAVGEQPDQPTNGS